MKKRVRKALPGCFALTALLVLLVAWGGYAQEISPELRSRIAAYKRDRETLQNEIKAVVQSNRSATRVEKQIAIQNWRERNIARISSHKKNAALLRADIGREITRFLETLGNVTVAERQYALNQWKEQNFESLGLFEDIKRSRMDQMRQRFRENTKTCGKKCGHSKKRPLRIKN